MVTYNYSQQASRKFNPSLPGRSGSLRSPYLRDGLDFIVHCLPLERIDEEARNLPDDLYGVHGGVRPASVKQDSEFPRPMLLDFDKAPLVQKSLPTSTGSTVPTAVPRKWKQWNVFKSFQLTDCGNEVGSPSSLVSFRLFCALRRLSSSNGKDSI
ncbi:hypothetical protein EMPG_17162 [Blastomyces silverae]|uniref:Uncharacterized protein n=1 Tax=Blastomyces silverae TaxID=2060906 RepID=A0A0H1B7E8_9EURO|nr:hypothetical protein EMPG_17162 [Blastomyces silverae]